MLPVVLRVEDTSRIPEARNAARSMARALGFDDAAAERAAIVAVEACTNLIKHARGGTLIVTPTADLSIELLALDRGPGMANVRQCLADGYSTTGTPGTGLGAITRLSTFSDAYSQSGRGTVMFALITNQAAAKLALPRVCGVRASKPGQEVCGDDWTFKRVRSRRLLMVADGLGHGPDAAAAARAAVDIFQKQAESGPVKAMEAIHFALRPTRGAAVAVAEFDEERRVVHFVGLGNVAGYVCARGGTRQQMVSMNGTAGIEGRTTFREFSYPWPEGSVLVLHSDGLTGHWDLGEYPGLIARDPALIAGVLFRDYSRGTDDATVVVAA